MFLFINISREVLFQDTEFERDAASKVDILLNEVVFGGKKI